MTTLLLYEKLLDLEPEFAMSEGSRHFEEKSAVQDTLRRITQRLNELGIEYAVAGGMALFFHGFRRFTEDVDILVTADGLQRLHETLEGRGYRPPFAGSKNLRDTENGVRIEFLVAGQFPGDGKPKPIAFPEPSSVSEAWGEIRLLNLRTLIELKLASGMSNAGRLKDLADVQELVKLLHLPEDYAEQLDVYVRDRYRELWQGANESSLNEEGV